MNKFSTISRGFKDYNKMIARVSFRTYSNAESSLCIAHSIET